MEILLVSQCDHKALKETRRILDQFACRTGERCWQTPMTMNGLETLHRMLRATARKNTAVACHRMGVRGGAALQWIVGDTSRFDALGHVPTQSTQQDILRDKDENHWDSAEAVRLLARMAGLLHDLGKASKAFQDKLSGTETQINILRHEWQSAQMLAYFVRSSGEKDADWLACLAKGEGADLKDWGAERDWQAGEEIYPLKGLPPLAKAIIWLIVSHHRLPVSPDGERFFGDKALDIKIDSLRHPLDRVYADWNNQKQMPPEDKKKRQEYENFKKKYSDFKALQPILSENSFSKMLKNTAGRFLKFQEKAQNWPGWESDLYILHLARLSLMLADHHVSSWGTDYRPALKVKKDQAIANTDKGKPKQSLQAHLMEIAKVSGSIANFLENFIQPLSAIPPQKMQKFRKRAPSAFGWQNKAYEAGLKIREKAAENGCFIVNMASTGCGKTLGNGKILAALTPEKMPLRFSYALGLRVLTHQTGKAYREHLSLGKTELGVFVGGAVSKEISEFLAEKAQETGSESEEALLADNVGEMLFETDPSREEDWEKHPLLSAIYGIGKESGRKNRKERSFLDAPVLVCTVDHLVPATEGWRGGHQINPMLRLMSSDLILDELDDYSLEDMPALTRLVWYCGLLGRKVLLSSATLPESLVRGMFLAYRAGREIYLKNHGGYRGALSQTALEIPCLWVDEFKSEAVSCQDEAGFKAAHDKFSRKRGEKLLEAAKEKPLRRGKIIGQAALGSVKKAEIPAVLAELFREKSLELHHAHGEIIPEGIFKGKKLSFGLIRMANIGPLYQVAMAFFKLGCAEDDTMIHLCVYHSRFPLICRSAIETGLDRVFNRKKDKEKPWEREEVIDSLAKSGKKIKNHVFIVLASPVCEVGRDWDADWAIAEPSSLRSIIQLAGRVQRHRQKITDAKNPNIYLLNKNVKSLEGNRIAYARPGYEAEDWALKAHDLETLLRQSEYENITSIPRLLIPGQRQPPQDWELAPSPNKAKDAYCALKLGDLELAKTAEAMGVKPKKWQNPDGKEIGRREAALCWWEDFSQTALTGLLPQNQPFREQILKEIDLAFVWDEDKERPVLEQALKGKGHEKLYTETEWQLERLKISVSKHISAWNRADLAALLQKWLEDYNGESEESDKAEARRVTAFSARPVQDGKKWQWNEVLGLDFM